LPAENESPPKPAGPIDGNCVQVAAAGS